jgi:mRNA-degrading endonuclease toxin of MazEF toxin-antitoxin module
VVVLTDCPLFERSCPRQIVLLTHQPLNLWPPLYHAELRAAPIFADHRGLNRDAPHLNSSTPLLPNLPPSGACHPLTQKLRHIPGGLPVILVVPLTTTQAALRFAGTTRIQPSTENGLRQVSVALVFQLRAIDRQGVEERIGSVSRTLLNEIFAELDKLTGRTA